MSQLNNLRDHVQGIQHQRANYPYLSDKQAIDQILIILNQLLTTEADSPCETRSLRGHYIPIDADPTVVRFELGKRMDLDKFAEDIRKA